MKNLLKLLSLIGLLLTVVPSLLYFADAIALDTHKWLVLVT